MKPYNLRTCARVTVLAVMATGLASMTPAQASVTRNSLTQNGLTQNALTQNSLSQNALTVNALTVNALSSNALNGSTPASDAIRNLNGIVVESVILPTAAVH